MDESKVVSDGSFLGALKRLSMALQSPPAQGEAAILRHTDISEAAAIVLGHGLDAEAFVRYGLGRRLARSIAVWTVLLRRGPGPEVKSLMSEIEVDFDAWARTLGCTSDGSDPAAVYEELQRAEDAIFRWVMAAPYEDILGWNPPAKDDLLRMPGSGEGISTVCGSYVWLRDRFLGDEVQDWEPESLRLEYKWQKALVPNPCPEMLMGLVDHDFNSITSRLAELFVIGNQDDERGLFIDIQRQSLDLLQQKRHLEAAMLFEFYTKRHASDPTAINNRAFCLIPVDPSLACQLLKEARRRGFAPRGINIYNQMLCLSRVAREAEALDLAENYWQREFEPEPVSGVIWDYPNSDMEMIQVTDVRDFIASLASEICTTLGLDNRAITWGDRLAVMNPSVDDL